MNFRQCMKCGLSLPAYMVKKVIINGRKAKVCDNCLKVLKAQFKKGK